ncbi:MAG TPA: hypothetical protein VFH31_05380 [Pyrinomonadaceae bacterium]|nr:hypothetical protein [Pyrinomonadaceae bacterium]
MCKCTPGIKTPFCGKPGCECPAQKPYVSPREDGWYWVRKMGWGDQYGDWVPALWMAEYRSWKSALFSGIPDSEMIVGAKMVPPNVELKRGAQAPEQTSDA